MGKKYPDKPILMIDDEINNLNSVEMILNMEKINNIVTCNDSCQVEQLLTKQQYSMVILDLSMPFVSGEHILQLMHNRYSNVPVIIVTGNQDMGYDIRNIKSEIWDYLIKPVNLTELVSTVKRVLKLNELRNKIQF